MLLYVYPKDIHIRQAKMKDATKKKPESWLLLLYSLPATHKTERVAIWRKLAKSGAVQIKTSTYLLPDKRAQYELFQWLAKQVRDYGGESTLVRAREIEGMPNRQLVDLFNSTREKEYAAVIHALRKLIGRKTQRSESFAGEFEKLKKEFHRIREIDFFDSPRAHDAEGLVQQLQVSNRAKKLPAPRLRTKHYQNKTWVTRPRPEIDRVASAWLIRRFIDPKAKFVFAKNAASIRNALPFDFAEGEFSHHGEDCTFETMLQRFRITDKALRKIAEMVHDADLEDEKFQRPECIGIDRVLKGWAKQGMPDTKILEQGGACLDGLYAALQRL
jgi:hypothetical protein